MLGVWPLSSHIQWACYKRWKVEWETQTSMCQCSFDTDPPSPKLLWTYCSGYAGVKGNDRADRLAGKAATTSGSVRLRRPEVLRSLRHYCGHKGSKDLTPSIAWRRGVERAGYARRSSLKGRGKTIVNQTNIGTISKATVGKLLWRETGWSAK